MPASSALRHRLTAAKLLIIFLQTMHDNGWVVHIFAAIVCRVVVEESKCYRVNLTSKARNCWLGSLSSAFGGSGEMIVWSWFGEKRGIENNADEVCIYAYRWHFWCSEYLLFSWLKELRLSRIAKYASNSRILWPRYILYLRNMSLLKATVFGLDIQRPTNTAIKAGQSSKHIIRTSIALRSTQSFGCSDVSLWPMTLNL
jgi:hypothetical protein